MSEEKDTRTQKEKITELLKEENEEFFIAQIDKYLKKKEKLNPTQKGDN